MYCSIASHVCDQLLQAGYQVRGTVRSEEKAKWLYELFDSKYGKGKFTAVTVPDMVADGAFDEAVKGVSGICHVASVLTFSKKVEEVIPPTVKGTLNILTAATLEPKIKSFVYTSSSTAALTPVLDKKIVVTKETWNAAVVEETDKNAEADPFIVYSASKTLAEQAVWKAVKETNPPFQVAAVLPNANYGKILQPGGEMSSSTGSWPVMLFNGDKTPLNFPPQWFVDVADNARIHVAALIDPSCNGQRIFAFAQTFNWSEVLDGLRKGYPNKHFIDGIEGEGHDLSEMPNSDAEELLRKHFGKGWTTLDESLKENTATLA